MTSRSLAYGTGALIGIAAALLALPLDTIAGFGAGWHPPGSDQAQSLSGHLAFQADAWRWPLLKVDSLFVPHGISIVLTDSNPLLSLVAKLWTKTTGWGPVNLFGAWVTLCWVLQPIAAIYAARGLRLGFVPSAAAGILAASWPALLFRTGHLNLCAHFMILFALGVAIRRIARPGGWAVPAALLLVSVLIQPYIFELCAVVLAAIPLHAAFARRPRWKLEAGGYLLSGMLAVGALTILGGPPGGGDKGFVFFSMNLLSPIWPQRSGVFGADLPVIDATGGQAEGYNWLGAGVLLLLLVAIAQAAHARVVRGGRWVQAGSWPHGLLIVLAGLALLSLSSRVYAGPLKLLDLGAKPWEDIFGTFRAPGRAFWPVGYALMLAGIAAVARLPRGVSIPLLLIAAALQVIDAGPLRATERQSWESGAPIAAPMLPAGTTMLTVVPFPGCTPLSAAKSEGPIMLLEAVRNGARTGDIGLGRSPRWFSCERILSDATELPFEPGEVRAFFTEAMPVALRTQAFGPGASCRQNGDAIVCGRDVAAIDGTPIPSGTPLLRLTLPQSLAPAELAPILGTGWRITATGEVWSEGPRSTLVFAVQSGTDMTATLHLSGIAVRAGGTRGIRATVGRAASTDWAVADGNAIFMELPIPATAAPWGLVRIALDVERPVDPAKRGMSAPVQRAAMRLTGLELREGATAPTGGPRDESLHLGSR